MSPFLQPPLSCIQHPFARPAAARCLLLCALALSACGEVTCPSPLSNIDGMCIEVEPQAVEKPEPDAGVELGVERCDGADNDGDTEVDEDWPELGEACGEGAGVGECVAGEFVCNATGTGVVCEGAVGPSDEVCDGKDNDCNGTPDDGPEETCDGEDNDCDGLIDEGARSIKTEVFSDHATVSAVEGGFAVTRVIADQIRVETYDSAGNRTGHHDDTDVPTPEVAFIESDASGTRLLVALGKYTFHVLDVRVDSDRVPIIVEVNELHSDWKQGMTLGAYTPPLHPRVLTSPSRFVGYRDLITFALNPFAEADLYGLRQEPTVATEMPMFAAFDAAGPLVVWEQAENVRAGWLLDDGSLLLDIDVARGTTPGIGIGKDGPGVAYLDNGSLRLSELGGLSLLCLEGRFCNERLDANGSEGSWAGPTGLAFDKTSDTWFVLAGTQLLAVGRSDGGALVVQSMVVDALDEAVERVDVEVSGGTAAIVQVYRSGDSALSFLGCF